MSHFIPELVNVSRETLQVQEGPWTEDLMEIIREGLVLVVLFKLSQQAPVDAVALRVEEKSKSGVIL